MKRRNFLNLLGISLSGIPFIGFSQNQPHITCDFNLDRDQTVLTQIKVLKTKPIYFEIEVCVKDCLESLRTIEKTINEFQLASSLQNHLDPLPILDNFALEVQNEIHETGHNHYTLPKIHSDQYGNLEDSIDDNDT